jgi:hypothetical protein
MKGSRWLEWLAMHHGILAVQPSSHIVSKTTSSFRDISPQKSTPARGFMV